MPPILAALNERVLTALVVAGGLTLFGVLLVATAAGELRRRRKAKIPASMRPAPSDEELEKRVIERYLLWGAVSVIFVALWLPAYWLNEPKRLADKGEALESFSIHGREDSAERSGGEQLYSDFCVSCHGDEAQGGIRDFTIDGVDHTYAEPPLKFMFSRYKKAGRSEDEIEQIMRDAINRGRPNTPMPTWGFAFGGPFNTYEVDNLVAYLKFIQEDIEEADPDASGRELFAANCAVCHNGAGADKDPSLIGAGGVGPNLQVALERLTSDQVMQTIQKGRLNINRPSMPSWQFLGDDAIRRLVRFIESIQRSPS